MRRGCNRLLLLVMFLLASSQSFCSKQSVQDLRYGVTLYHFYQQHYFDALTELMAAQELQQLPNHSINAELLKGGMSLSYGLDRSSEEIFTRLLAEPIDGVDRNKAWFYLGKLEYQRGDFVRANTSLKKIAGEVDPRLLEEATYLKARLLLNNNDIAGASQQIAELSAESIWLPYYYYNLGVVQTTAGNPTAGVAAFKALETLTIDNAEEKALRDRAYTASGFANIEGGDLEQAKQDFSKVRIDSPLVDRALLGYGWALAQQRNYRAALSPWQQLSEHSLLYPSVQESLLAIPFAYETLGSPANALIKYQQAAVAYEGEIQRLDSAIDVFHQQAMEQLFNLSSSANDEWLVGGEILPINKQAPYLAQLIASHSFQQAIKDLRDLNRMSRYLRQARERLAVLNTVDIEQQELWQQVVDQSKMKSLYKRQQDLSVHYETMKKQLAQAVTENNGRRLSDDSQWALWTKLERAEKRIPTLASAGEDVSLAKTQLAVYRGMLLWADNESFPDKLWQHKKQLRSVGQLGDETALALQRVEQVIINRQQSEFSPRIAAQVVRLDEYQARVDRSLAQAETGIRTLAVSELEQQQQRLSYYLSQAKLAIARLYDRGSIEAMQ
jgi:ribosomal protein S17